MSWKESAGRTEGPDGYVFGDFSRLLRSGVTSLLQATFADKGQILLESATNGDEARTQEAIAAGANLEHVATVMHNGRQKGPYTPLLAAAMAGHAGVTERLLKAGAKKEARDEENSTPLLMAASRGHEAVARLLLEAGADKEAQDVQGGTALVTASRFGHAAVAKVLLDFGAEVEAKNDNGSRPLMMAAAQLDAKEVGVEGYLAIAQLLLAADAKLEEANNLGHTPLICATDKGREGAVKLLLDARAKIEARDGMGNTPLLKAVTRGHEAVTRLLLDAGANLEAKDERSKKTSFEYARERGHSTIVALLHEANKKEAHKRGVWQLLAGAGQATEETIERAMRWFAEAGAANVGQIAHLNMVDEFVTALDLQPIPREEIRKALLGDEQHGLNETSGDAQMLVQVMSQLERVQAGIQELTNEVQTMRSAIRSNASMLGALLQDENSCPRWLVLVPKPEKKSKLARGREMFKSKHWLYTTVVLHFVCPITRTAVGDGFEIPLPKDWVIKYGPAIRIGLTLLAVGAGTARLAGLPVPNLSKVTGEAMDNISAQVGFLEGLKDGIANELEGAKEEHPELAQVNEWAREKLEGAAQDETALPPQLQRIVQQSYANVRLLLDGMKPSGPGSWESKVRDSKHCGLVKAVCSSDGSFEWVEPRWRDLYVQRGRDLLGLSREQLEALLAKQSQPAELS